MSPEFAQQSQTLTQLLSMGPVVCYQLRAGPGGTPRVIWISENVGRLSGYTPEQFCSDPDFWARNIHPDDRKAALEWQDAIWQGKVATHEYRFRVSDGSYRWFREEQSVVDTDGQPSEIIGSVVDVTAQRQAEAARAVSNARLNAHLMHTPLAAVAWDGERILTEWNPAAEIIFGHLRDDVIGRPVGEVIGDDCCNDESFEETVRSFVKAHRTKSGRTILCEWYTTPVDEGENGSSCGVAALGQDVTEREHTRSLLGMQQGILEMVAEGAELEATLDSLCSMTQSLVPGSVCLVMLLGADGLLRIGAGPDLSAEARADFEGLTPGELAASCGTAVHTRSQVLVADALADERWEAFRDAASRYQIRSCWSTPILVESGDILGTFAVCGADPGLPEPFQARLLETATSLAGITIQRERADAALRESEQRYRGVFDHANDAILLSRADDSIEDVNYRACELLGYSRAELLGMAVNDIHDEPFRASRDAGRRDLASFGDIPFEAELISKDGVRIPGEITRARLGNGYILSVVRDIRERRRAEGDRLELERRVLHAQKLESLGVLAGGIAHDFNNFLAGILGQAVIARQQIETGCGADDALALIEQATQDAAELTNQMLAYSGRGSFVVEPLELSSLIGEMRPLLDASVSKNAVVEYNIRPGARIRGDAAQIRQVFMNLITNASDSLGASAGTISVTVDEILADADYLREVNPGGDATEGRYVFMEVSDTGCGMDETTASRMFDPFFSTKFTGRGLGLAAVQGIVRGHKGAVTVRSEPDAGTTIRVLFPVTAADVEQKRVPRADSAMNGSGTILLIEDDAIIRQVLTRILDQSGYTVMGAASGEEGLEVFKGHAEQFVAVVLDLTLPGVAGEEVFRRIHADDDEIPIILMSGFTEQEVADRGSVGDMAAFLQKPFRPEALTNAVNSIVNAAKQVSP